MYLVRQFLFRLALNCLDLSMSPHEGTNIFVPSPSRQKGQLMLFACLSYKTSLRSAVCWHVKFIRKQNMILLNTCHSSDLVSWKSSSWTKAVSLLMSWSHLCAGLWASTTREWECLSPAVQWTHRYQLKLSQNTNTAFFLWYTSIIFNEKFNGTLECI